MKDPTSIGLNRTGIDASPIDSKEVVAEAERTPPSAGGSVGELLAERAVFLKEADPLGTVPPPGTLKGVLKAGIQKAALKRPEAFIDKLAERLAFERTGTRLYEAFILKCEARPDEAAGIPLEEIRAFRDAEHSHFLLVVDALRTLGADPTAVTPCADAAAVESIGLLQVLTDPRTSVSQSLHSILVAELADNDGWSTLIEMAESLKQSKIAERFRAAYAEEQRHLRTVRAIFADMTRDLAKAA